MSIFDHIISAFYQVDLHIATSATTIPLTPNRSNIDIEAAGAQLQNEVMIEKVIHEGLGSSSIIERKVQYGRYMLRLTFSKENVPYSKLWKLLLELQHRKLIQKYVYRHMDMEEALSTIIANEKEE